MSNLHLNDEKRSRSDANRLCKVLTKPFDELYLSLEWTEQSGLRVGGDLAGAARDDLRGTAEMVGHELIER